LPDQVSFENTGKWVQSYQSNYGLSSDDILWQPRAL